jgi:hypothetical protein
LARSLRRRHVWLPFVSIFIFLVLVVSSLRFGGFGGFGGFGLGFGVVGGG